MKQIKVQFSYDDTTNNLQVYYGSDNNYYGIQEVKNAKEHYREIYFIGKEKYAEPAFKPKNLELIYRNGDREKQEKLSNGFVGVFYKKRGILWGD